MDDFKLYCRNEIELDSFAQTMHIFSIDYIEMEFSMDVSDRERKDCEISWRDRVVELPDVKKVGSYLEISRGKNENYARNSEALSKR